MPDGSQAPSKPAQARPRFILKDEAATPLMDALTRCVQATRKDTCIGYAKVSLIRLWKILPVKERREFLRRLDDLDDYEFIEFPRRFPNRKDAKLELAARDWSAVRVGLEGKERDFAESIQKQLRYPNWSPSDKQAEWMKKLWKAHEEEKAWLASQTNENLVE